jgi:L-fuconolactonase
MTAMWIDSHQHFWLMRDRVGQWPPPELAKIHRDFVPADLEPTLRACGVKGTVLVQSLPTMADTDFMLRLADRHPFIVGVVGWVDLKAADAAVHIARLAAHPKLRSLRPMLQDIADVAWIDDPALDPAIEAMRSYGLRFDALVMPQHLGALTTFAKRHPDLPIVIDHGAKPRIATGYFSAWRTAMAALGLLPNVHCKLSGLLTEAGSGASPLLCGPMWKRFWRFLAPLASSGAATGRFSSLPVNTKRGWRCVWISSPLPTTPPSLAPMHAISMGCRIQPRAG